MKKEDKSILVVLVVTLLLGVGPVVAATPISCGMVIHTPGQYHLSSDLVCDSGVKVAANDVYINMNGHALTGPGAGSGITTSDGHDCVPISGLNITGGTIKGFGSGIVLCESINAHVSAMTLTGNDTGIRLFYSNGNQINGNDISDNGGDGLSGYGVSLTNSHGNGFNSNKVNGNSSTNAPCGGFYITGSYNNSITSNDISANGSVHNGFGILLRESSKGNTVRANTVNGNTSYGIGVHNASNNIIQDNTVQDNEEVGIRISGRSTNNTVQSNTALENGDLDLSDSHPDCANNTWKRNTFGTRDQSCI